MLLFPSDIDQQRKFESIGLKTKHQRTQVAAWQLAVLESIYAQKTYPSSKLQQLLHEKFQIPRPFMSKWFQNKRAREKRKARLYEERQLSHLSQLSKLNFTYTPTSSPPASPPSLSSSGSFSFSYTPRMGFSSPLSPSSSCPSSPTSPTTSISCSPPLSPNSSFSCPLLSPPERVSSAEEEQCPCDSQIYRDSKLFEELLSSPRLSTSESVQNLLRDPSFYSYWLFLFRYVDNVQFPNNATSQLCSSELSE